MLLGDGWALLYSLLRHYAPRRITGHLRFGTGDPSSTGKLTGLLYMLLPVRANRFLIQPEFTEAVFETEFAASGRIRACHFAGMAWKLFRDKRLRRVIRAVRK